MAGRERTYTEQLVVRVDGTLLDALKRDAAENGRTIAQSARFHLTRATGLAPA